MDKNKHENILTDYQIQMQQKGIQSSKHTYYQPQVPYQNISIGFQSPIKIINTDKIKFKTLFGTINNIKVTITIDFSSATISDKKH